MDWHHEARGSIVADWKAGDYLAHTDPYLVWLDLSNFAGAGLPQGDGLLPVIEETGFELRFRTRAYKRDELQALANPAWRHANGVLRFEVAAGMVSDDIAVAAIDTAAPAGKGLAHSGFGTKAVVGFIDYGCAFAHRHFRTGGNGLDTRVKAVWDQGGRVRLAHGELQWQRPRAFDYGAETHRDIDWAAPTGALNLNAYLRKFVQAGMLDEETCYRRSGYEPIIGRRATHGTHMMDLATGWPSPLQHLDKLGMPGPAEPHDADIVFVQLPRHAQGRQISGLLRANVHDAVAYIIDCTPPDQPAVINLSYGANAGPHDGSSVLEQALDWQLKRAALQRKRQVHLVIAAGNARDHDMHARATLPPHGSASFQWNNLPDDPSDSFVEFWFPPAANEISVRVTPPGSQPSGWLSPGDAGGWRNAGVAAALVFPHQACQSPSGRMALLAVARTRPLPGRPIAPYGAWRIEVRNASGNEAAVHAWCERDIPAFGGEGVPRQGNFSATDSSAIDTDCTLNSIAHGQETIVVGGYAIGGAVAEYSGTGPGRDLGRRLRRASAAGEPPRRGPDMLAPSDESPAMPGLLAAAVMGSDSVRLAGTSMAAAVATRRIVESGFVRPAPPQKKGPPPAAATHPDSDLLP